MNWPLSQCHYARAVAEVPARPGLSGHDRTRVVVIGGGFAGLATAFGLVERGVREVTLLEAERIGYGASGRNGGFLMAGFPPGEAQLLRRHGRAEAAELYGWTVQAVRLLKRRIRDYDLDCDLRETGLVLADWFGDSARLRHHLALINGELGGNWREIVPGELSRWVGSARYAGGLLEPDGAHFHPLKYAQAVACQLETGGVRIHEHSPAISIDSRAGGYRVTSPDGVVDADQVVVCTGGYRRRAPRRVKRAILPIASFVAVTEPIPERLPALLPAGAPVYDTRFAFDYYRPLADGRLLWGGRISVRRPSGAVIRSWLGRDLLRVFPELAGVAFESAWGGLMGYPRHQMPIVGETRPGYWHVVGFGGRGVAQTTLGGELAAGAIAEGDERYRKLAGYRLRPVYGVAGLAMAQLHYWHLQAADWWRERCAGRL